MQSIFWGTLSLYEIFAYFFIYSFLGWAAEVAFHALSQGKFVNRGFLNGPVCPIYGTGIVLMLLILQEHASEFWAVFAAGVALPTLIELVTGWALEKLFHNKWWDYSERKFNFKGYICLEFSLLWGVAAVIVMFGVHPGVKWIAGLLNETAETVIICILIAYLIADLAITVSQVLKLNRKLKEIDDAAKAMRRGSDFIGGKVAAATIAVEGKVTSAKEKFDEKTAGWKERYDDKTAGWKERYDKKIDELVEKMPKRLLKAFPRLQSRRSPDGVSLAQESMRRRKERRKQEKLRKNPQGTENGTEEDKTAAACPEEDGKA